MPSRSTVSGMDAMGWSGDRVRYWLPMAVKSSGADSPTPRARLRGALPSRGRPAPPGTDDAPGDGGVLGAECEGSFAQAPGHRAQCGFAGSDHDREHDQGDCEAPSNRRKMMKGDNQQAVGKNANGDGGSPRKDMTTKRIPPATRPSLCARNSPITTPNGTATMAAMPSIMTVPTIEYPDPPARDTLWSRQVGEEVDGPGFDPTLDHVDNDPH